MIDRIRALLRALFARDQFESDMSHELRFHIEAYTADLVRAGVPPRRSAASGADRVRQRGQRQARLPQARGLHVFDVLGRTSDTRFA